MITSEDIKFHKNINEDNGYIELLMSMEVKFDKFRYINKERKLRKITIAKREILHKIYSKDFTDLIIELTKLLALYSYNFNEHFEIDYTDIKYLRDKLSESLNNMRNPNLINGYIYEELKEHEFYESVHISFHIRSKIDFYDVNERKKDILDIFYKPITNLLTSNIHFIKNANKECFDQTQMILSKIESTYPNNALHNINNG